MGENFLSFLTLDDTKRFTVVRTNKELFLCPYYQELYVSGLRFLFFICFLFPPLWISMRREAVYMIELGTCLFLSFTGT